jgi:hypothetical protein
MAVGGKQTVLEFADERTRERFLKDRRDLPLVSRRKGSSVSSRGRDDGLSCFSAVKLEAWEGRGPRSILARSRIIEERQDCSLRILGSSSLFKAD